MLPLYKLAYRYILDNISFLSIKYYVEFFSIFNVILNKLPIINENKSIVEKSYIILKIKSNNFFLKNKKINKGDILKI